MIGQYKTKLTIWDKKWLQSDLVLHGMPKSKKDELLSKMAEQHSKRRPLEKRLSSSGSTISTDSTSIDEDLNVNLHINSSSLNQGGVCKKKRILHHKKDGKWLINLCTYIVPTHYPILTDSTYQWTDIEPKNQSDKNAAFGYITERKQLDSNPWAAFTYVNVFRAIQNN